MPTGQNTWKSRLRCPEVVRPDSQRRGNLCGDYTPVFGGFQILPTGTARYNSGLKCMPFEVGTADTILGQGCPGTLTAPQTFAWAEDLRGHGGAGAAAPPPPPPGGGPP